jgi:Ser/Thr protein kinase RdoA (MazF antagonist)
VTETLGSPLATGNVAEVYDLPPQVLKLYKSPTAKPTVFREAALHAAVEAMGLPVPVVWGVRQVGQRWGIIFERISGSSFAADMRGVPELVPEYLACLARLHVAIHGHPADMFPDAKTRLSSRIAEAEALSRERRNVLCAGVAGMPDGERLCHGDFHPMNVLGTAERPIVIDWPDASRGDPAADVCRSYLLLHLYAAELADPYVDAYCRVGSISREAVSAWLPFIAAARLAESFPGELERLLQIVEAARRA